MRLLLVPVFMLSILVLSGVAGAQVSSLVATPNPFSLSNTEIGVGQISVANTVISGGSGGPYFGELTFLNSNQINNQVVNTIPVGIYSYQVAFNPSGTLAYVTNDSGSGDTVNVINVASNAVVNTITVGTAPLGVAFNPSGTLAYVAIYAGSGTVNVINVASNTVVNTIPVGAYPSGIAFNPSGTLAYVTNYGSGTVNVINVASNTVVNTIPVNSGPADVAFNPSGTLAYVANHGFPSPGNTISVINVASNTVVNTITVGIEPNSAAFNPSGTLAYVANYGSGTVNVINVASNTVVNTIPVGAYPYSVVFNPSGTLAYVTNYNLSSGNTISVINVASNTVVNTITVGSRPLGPSGIAFNPSGTLVYVTNANRGPVSVIGNLPETSLQPLPSSNTLKLTINAQNSNTLILTFNGVTYTENTGSKNIYGPWALYGFAEDSNGYYEDSSTPINIGNTVLLSNTLTIDPSLAFTSLTASNSLIDGGQTQVIATAISGGTPPYTYNFLVYNSIGLVANALYTDLSATTNSFAFTQNNAWGAGPFTVNAFATDSASTPVTVSNSIVYGANAIPNVLAPSNAVLDLGQYETYNVLISGGTGPFTVNLIYVSGPGTVNSIIAGNVIESLTAQSDGTASFASFNSFSTTGIYTFNVVATDSASTHVTFNSVASTITVDSVPHITLALTPSNSIIYGNPFTVNALISGGTGHFAVYWFINGNSITPTVINSNAETSNTMQLPAAGNYAYTVEANDIGTSSVYTLTPATNTVVVSSNSTLTASETGNPGTSYFEQPVSITFTGTQTINNQSAWSLYVNGVLFGKTASTITWSESMKNPGTYSFTFNNPGNSNYTANSITTTLNIVYPPSGVTGPATTVTTTIPTTTVTTTIPPTPIVGSSGTVNKTISSSAPVTLNFSNELAIFSISTTSSTSTPISAFVSNATRTAPPAPSNFTLINALNISIKTNVNVTTNVTIAYPCSDSASSIEPFIYKNGTWSAITPFFVNPSTCTVSFAVPSDPLVGIFAKTAPVTTTVPTTTVVPTTTIPTTVPVTPVAQHYTGLEIAIVVIVIIVIILVIAYYYAAKNKGRRRS
jgi:YVTN family beta-propeller protein